MYYDFELEKREKETIKKVLEKYKLKDLNEYLPGCMHTIIFDYTREKDITFDFDELKKYIKHRFDGKKKESILYLVDKYYIVLRTLPTLQNNKVVYEILSNINLNEIKYHKEQKYYLELVNTIHEDINKANDKIHKKLEKMWREYRKKFYAERRDKAR